MERSFTVSAGVADDSGLRILEIFKNTKYLSTKLDSYFQVYEELFNKYVGQNITFVEVGVQNGGSLNMWRDYFGPNARIIGVDLNPLARRLQKDGFEIFIGDQSDPMFWEKFYQQVGSVDVLLDDGGHTNHQQIVTTCKGIQHINDGGRLVVEDVHASYLRLFGNPSKYSFVNFSKHLIDSINSRFAGVEAVKNDYWKRVFSISFYESIIVFNIDSKKSFVSNYARSNGINFDAEDFGYKNTLQGAIVGTQKALINKWKFSIHLPLARRLLSKIASTVGYALARVNNRKLKAFFK